MLALSYILVFLFVIYNVESVSVVIVGAGAAGIAAASKLYVNNITDFIILEAESRIGGRIKSVYFGDAYVDLGANTCSHMTDNIVYKLAKDFDYLYTYDVDINVYLSNREQVDPKLESDLTLIGSTTYVDLQNATEGEYVGEGYTKRYNGKVSDKYGGDMDKLRVANLIGKLFHNVVNSIEGGNSWFDGSARRDVKIYWEEEEMSWPVTGFQKIFDIMMNVSNSEGGTPIEDRIFFDRVVKTIKWKRETSDNEKSVTVLCEDGARYVADYVIFTPSLGVLKETHKKVFLPQLPVPKKEVINKLGFGSSGVCYLLFPEQWWSDLDTSFLLVWTDDDEMKIAKEFPKSLTKNMKPWILDIVGFLVENYNRNILSAVFAGSEIASIEKLSHDDMVDGAHYILNKFLGHKYNISKALNVICSDWETNPHFYGAQSYQTVDSRKLPISPEVILSKPVLDSKKKPVILFAGEATHPYYYGTVHGAIETGYREAQRILGYENRNSTN